MLVILEVNQDLSKTSADDCRYELCLERTLVRVYIKQDLHFITMEGYKDIYEPN